MRVHVLVHAVVDDRPAEIPSLVDEILQTLHGTGTIVSCSLNYNEMPDELEAGLEIEAPPDSEEDNVAGALAVEGGVEPLLSASELRALAAQSIARAARWDEHHG